MQPQDPNNPQNVVQPGTTPPVSGGVPPQPQPSVVPPQGQQINAIPQQPQFSQPVTPMSTPTPTFQSQPQPSGSGTKKIVIIAVAALVVLGGGAFALTQLGVTDKVADVAKTGSLSGGASLEDTQISELGVTVKVPKDWEKKLNLDLDWQKDATFTKPRDYESETKQYRSSLLVRKEDYSSPDRKIRQVGETQYFKAVKRNLQEDAANQANMTYKRAIESEEPTTVNGLSAYKVKFKVENYDYETGAIGYEYSLYVWADNATRYYINLGAHESEKDILAKADEILGSLKTN